MAGVSRNSIDLIRNAFAKLKGKFGKAFIATLIAVSPLMLCFFTVYGIVGTVAFFGIFQVGYIRYMRALIDGQNPSYKVLFSEFAEPWMEVFLSILLFAMYALGYTLFVIPGVIVVGLFSMAFFIAEFKKSETPFTAMKDTVKYMKGNYTNMFGFKVLYWLMYLLVIVVGSVGVAFVIKLWAGYKFVSILLLVLTYIVVTLLWSLVSVYYHTTQELFFRELLLYYEHDKKQEVEKEVVIIEEEKEEDVSVVAVAEKSTEVKKAPAKKSTTAKSSTSKATAAKAPVKKATAKSTTSRTASKPAAKTTTSKSTTAKKTTTKTSQK